MSKNQRPAIRSVKTKQDANGNPCEVNILFGEHHFLDLRINEAGRVELYLGATHHGVKADASDVPSELERMVEHLRVAFPRNTID